MAFVDEAHIIAKGGNGGKGCESFYTDKYTRQGIPDGGDGGNGGDIIIAADKSVQTLLDFRLKRRYEGGRGGHASSKGSTGYRGKECVLRVPVGTILRDADTGLLIKDLTTDRQTVVVAKGGLGGRGNRKHRSVLPPKEGEEKHIHLELKIIADVGIVGFPNVGKSTLISAMSKVRSRIGNYHFTTRQPILGVVEGEDFNFVVADLPGLIEGAHLGKGLGDRFLKHAERTKILLHMVDMSGSEGRDPLDDYKKIEHELDQYSSELAMKYQLVAANKMDLPSAERNLKRFKRKFKIDVVPVSALEKQNLDQLTARLYAVLAAERKGQENAA